ncbi:hypothetical protein [Nocardioides acrostichi]|uniref:C1q domain-containing protein n=1 Tax=Nocardioides acrostichi TaxID=2784339 RepID=A0A930V3J9_9ACTN|nr:hypothetical protein [Nocardioides acrostichi]MBF4163080.1 hypothetical protein [Nocardioides acrostichi]
MSKPSRAAVVATVLSAALLAVTANTVSYAAGGKSVLLGKTNKSASTTTLKSTSTKPPLKLVGPGVPMKVGNSKRIDKLNADKLDGFDASDLSPTTLVDTVGAPGDPAPEYSSAETTYALTPGLYRVDLNFVLEGSTAGDPYCYVFPTDQVLVSSDYSNILGTSSTQTFFPVSISGVVEVPEGDSLTFGCEGSSGYTMHSAGRFAVEPVASIGAIAPASIRADQSSGRPIAR